MIVTFGKKEYYSSKTGLIRGDSYFSKLDSFAHLKEGRRKTNPEIEVETDEYIRKRPFYKR